jgi:phenylacetate-coenzyme A ligase PaaK-like adenylate-forming protein
MLAFDTNNIFAVNNLTFTEQALALFRYQYAQNTLYKDYVDILKTNIENVQKIEEIPFLPISFFKNKEITTTAFTSEIIFTSSGTTGHTTASHYVKEIALYQQSFTQCFQHFYGELHNYCILGLLPAYLERTGSSLIYMVEDFIQKSEHPLSDFYLYEHEQLYLILQELEKDKQPTILFGVTFALLDFAAKFKMHLQHVIIIETGGMKGRGKEWTTKEVHDFLKTQLGVTTVHSEYGMTELLSQAYAPKDALYTPPNWMRVLVRAEDDPLQVQQAGKGILNIIDLANVYSCAFIATDDLGVVHTNNTFNVLGRLDHSDIRGCSLLVTNL